MTELMNIKESPLKMLLTAPTNPGHLTSSSLTSIHQINILPVSTMTDDDGQTKLITYFNQYSLSGENELDPIIMDHCYSRAWNWRPETSYIRPTKTLFIKKYNSRANPTLTLQKSIEEKDILDVESVTPPPTPIYDEEKAKAASEEFENYASVVRLESNDDWEDTVQRTNWNTSQNRLFSAMVKILNSDHMARLAYTGTWNEPILKRAVIDKSVQRVRNLMATISWDHKLTQWLHNLLMDHLSTQYLAAYLDILQTLKSKLPQMVEKMIFGSNTLRIGPLSNENLFPLLKKPWDPLATGLMQDKPKKLPGNPIFIVAPSFTSTSTSQTKYLHKWIKLLSNLAHVITVHANLGQTCYRMNMTNCADHLFNATRAKLQEVRNDCPGRPVILVGFNTGAAVVCQVAEVEHAVAVVCLGFPLLTAEGKRGEPEDYLLELMYPVLFVVGQNSNRTSREDMEDLRERMKIETGLVVVGSADDYLRISKSKRKSEGITQSIVDRCVLDEINEFVGSILISPYPPVTRPLNYTNDQYNNKHMKNRIRNNSNCSSLESEPPSPQPRSQTRPVGRPPGSGKKKLNFQGTSPSPTPTFTPIPTPPPANNTPQTKSLQPTNLEINSDPNNPGLTTYLTKPEAFRASKTPEALNRAVQSITPQPLPNLTVSSHSSPAPQPQVSNVVTNRSIITTGSQLSTLLQTGVRPNTSTIHARPISNVGNVNTNTGVKILENITVSSGLTQKILSNGRPVTLLNTVSGGRATNFGNVVLLPDGTKYIRSTGNALPATVRTVGGASTVLPTLNRNQGQMIKTQSSNTGITKLVPTRRQIITKQRVVPQENTTVHPTNLTTADIMDLPIIFADDNLVSDTPLEENNQQILTIQKPKQISNNKLVVINKQIVTTVPSTTQQHQITQTIAGQQQTLKRSIPGTSRPSQPVKYAKIIVSKRTSELDQKAQTITTIQPQKSPRKYDPNSFDFDLEAELKATTVPKPNAAILSAQLNKKQQEAKQQSFVNNKKSTVNGGQLANVTLRVPVNFNKSVNASGPSRFVYGDPASAGDNQTQVVLNRTVTSQSNTSKSENYTIRYENKD